MPTVGLSRTGIKASLYKGYHKLIRQPVHASRRLPVVGVMGSGTHGHRKRAGMLGRWLAKEGAHLLTGGGLGVMAAVSEAFFKVEHRKGLVIGIIPGSGDILPEVPPGYPNPYVELPIFTHLPLSGFNGMDVRSRNHINVLTASAIIALPGSAGTISEVKLALGYRRPVTAFINAPDEMVDLPEGVTITDDFETLKAWVRSSVSSHRR